jgi:hypothetical protein
MSGAPLEIAVDFATAVLGVWLISVGIVGFFLRTIALPRRLVFGLAGLLALMPSGLFPGAIYFAAVGAIAGLVLIAVELRASRAAKLTPASAPPG